MTSHEPYNKRKKTFLWILKALIGGFQNRGCGVEGFGGDPGNVRNWVKIGEQTKTTMGNPMDLVTSTSVMAKTWQFRGIELDMLL